MACDAGGGLVPRRPPSLRVSGRNGKESSRKPVQKQAPASGPFGHRSPICAGLPTLERHKNES